MKILVKQHLKERGIEQVKYYVRVEEIVQKIVPKAKELVMKEHLQYMQAEIDEIGLSKCK